METAYKQVAPLEEKQRLSRSILLDHVNEALSLDREFPEAMTLQQEMESAVAAAACINQPVTR